MAIGDIERDWPFERVDCSPAAREVLEAFWYQTSQRRPFKWDFPKMYETEPQEWDAMTQYWADAIEKAIERGPGWTEDAD